MKQKKASSQSVLFFIYTLGICAMCGRQISRWHIGYGEFGFELYLVVVVVYAMAFIALTYSFAELISIVPFSGGCYGYSRCAMGPMMGYVAGMFEAAKYILYATFNINRLGDIFLQAYGFDEKYQIIVWLAFLIVFNLVHYFQTKMLWWTIALVGIAIFVIQVIFIFGATSEGSVTNIQASRWDSDPDAFLKSLPYAVYMLSALDAVRTCVDDQQGSDVVPKALLHIMAWSIVAAFASIVAQSAYNYDDHNLVKEDYAYNVGLRMVFSMSSNNKFVTLFSLPGGLGCSLAFLYCAARQVRSMASSGLLPPFLAMGQGERVKDISQQPIAQATSVVPGSAPAAEGGLKAGDDLDNLTQGHKPTMAVFACSLLCFSLLLVGYYLINDYNDIYTEMGQLLNSSMYQFLMISYVIFTTRFSNMERGLKSPFGIPGAIYAMAFFLLLFIVRLHYTPKSNKGYGVTLVVFTVGILVYYFMVVQNRQFFSKEEQEKFMKAYVVNANKTRKRGRSGSNSRQSSKSSGMMGMLAGAVGFIKNNVSRGASSRSRASSMSGHNKAGAGSQGSIAVAAGHNAVAPV